MQVIKALQQQDKESCVGDASQKKSPFLFRGCCALGLCFSSSVGKTIPLNEVLLSCHYKFRQFPIGCQSGKVIQLTRADMFRWIFLRNMLKKNKIDMVLCDGIMLRRFILMIEVKETTLKSMLDKAINKAKTNDTSPLLSMTEEINEYNPLLFFEAAGQLSMNRTFWSSTAEQFYVVGVGSAYDLAANISSIEQMESNWKQLLNESIIRNPYECPGTGMLALGGMSFDPAAKRSQLWEKFSHLSFIIPEFMLTKTEDASYLTINIRVSKD